MFGFGHFPELVLVLVLALIIFGPGKLPEIGGAVGKGIREFRKASTDLQDSFTASTNIPEPPVTRQIPSTPVQAAPRVVDEVGVDTTGHSAHN